MGSPKLTREEVLALRVSKHHLDCRAPASGWLRVVSEIGGLQAQSMSAARMALWSRVEDFVSELFDDALLRQRTLVKVYGMRGTVHVLTSKDWALYFTALKHSRRGDTLRGRGLAPEVIDEALHIAARTLSMGPATIKEFAAEVPTRLRSRLASSGPYPGHALIKDLRESVSVCFGPPRGHEVTYVTSDRWLTERPRGIPILKAQQELARRYLRAFAPATPTDFAYWSGLPPSDAQSAFDALSDLVEVAIDGQQSWMLQDDSQHLKRLRPMSSVCLLPDFDSYLLAHKDKTLFLDAVHHRQVFPGAARVARTLLFKGRVVGTWAAKRSGRGLRVDLSPFQKLPTAVCDIVQKEAEKLATFLGADHATMNVSKGLRQE